MPLADDFALRFCLSFFFKISPHVLSLITFNWFRPPPSHPPKPSIMSRPLGSRAFDVDATKQSGLSPLNDSSGSSLYFFFSLSKANWIHNSLWLEISEEWRHCFRFGRVPQIEGSLLQVFKTRALHLLPYRGSSSPVCSSSSSSSSSSQTQTAWGRSH